MISFKHRTAVSHGAVAAIAAMLSAAGTLGAIKFVETSVAQPAPAAPGQLLTQPLSDLPGREVRMSLLDRGPGQQLPSPPSRSPYLRVHRRGYLRIYDQR
jgi:hypothetical protein